MPSECPQNWGLLEKINKRWHVDQLPYWKGDYGTTYNDDYNQKYPKECYKVHPKIRMEGRELGKFDQRLKREFNYANQWYTQMTEKCKHRFETTPPTRKLMKVFEAMGPPEPVKKHNPKYMDPKLLVSSTKYPVEPPCSCKCQPKRCYLTMW